MDTGLPIGGGPAIGTGTTIGGGELTIVRPLGEGGMGAVYVALQKSTGKERALKLMHREIVADPTMQRRFVQEAKIGAQIKSEHVVDVVAAGVDEDTKLPYLVMELLEGEDLRNRLRRGPLPLDEARDLFEQLSHALGAAHEAGVVHRDLKPENVFLARSRRVGTGTFTVKVLDFGIAKLLGEATSSSTRGAVGSPMWMAPEQTAPGPVTPAADVWAMGIVAFEALTGRSFWRTANMADGNTVQLLREICIDPLPTPGVRIAEMGCSALPAGFDPWFARCVAREPNDRFADATQAWRAMMAVFDGTVSSLAATVDAVMPSALERTGEASSFTPPIRPETPIASARDATVPPKTAPRSPRWPLAAGLAIAVVGIAVGTRMRTQPAPVATVTAPPSATEPPPPPIVVPAPVASEPAPKPSAFVVATPKVATPAAATVSAPAKPSRVVSSPQGFTDPVDANHPVLWKVQDRNIRLYSRIVANESNVTDAVVRKASDWSSWEFLLCYKKAFEGLKDLPEGVLTLRYEIIDQLPRHTQLVSSTIENQMLSSCVVNNMIGKTINAAGPDGKGTVTYALRFVPD